MSRRSADTMKRSVAMGHGQQAVWDVIRELQDFTVTDISLRVDMHRKSIINHVKRLEMGGYVQKREDFDTAEAHEDRFHYVLVKDAGVHVPRLDREGKPVTQGAGNKNIWRTMRKLKEFSPLDVQVHASTEKVQVKINTVKAYCTTLERAGYLRAVVKSKSRHQHSRYRLIRDTGPNPPQIQRTKQLYDPNLNTVTYRVGDEHAGS